MEKFVNDFLQAHGFWMKAVIVWSLIAPFVHAYLMSFAILMFKVATRKPDEEGNVSKFDKRYLIRRNRYRLIATAIFTFFAVLLVLKVWSKTDAVLLGVFVGLISHGLGELVKYAEELAKNRARKEIEKIKGRE